MMVLGGDKGMLAASEVNVTILAEGVERRVGRSSL